VPTDMRASPGVLTAAALAAVLLVAVSRGAAGQGPSVRPDTATSARRAGRSDCWYSEGAFRFRGQRYSFFVGASLTQFASAASRAAYGAGRLSPIFDIYRPRRRGLSPALEVNDLRIGKDAASARVVGVSVGVQHRPLDADPSRRFVPYYGVTVGPRFTRSSTSGRTTVGGLGTLLGIEIMRSVRLTMRYEALPAVFGERLSTVSFGAAFRLPPYRARAAGSPPAARLAACADSSGAR